MIDPCQMCVIYYGEVNCIVIKYGLTLEPNTTLTRIRTKQLKIGMLSAEQQADVSQATPGPAVEHLQAGTCDGNCATF